jgi:hypothetical protein
MDPPYGSTEELFARLSRDERLLVSKEPGVRIQEPGGPGLSKRWNWIDRDQPAAAGSLSGDFLRIDLATLKLESSRASEWPRTSWLLLQSTLTVARAIFAK